MRILLTTQPAYGHFRPLLPLADALRARGHELRVASAARFAPVIEGHGLRPEVAGPDWLEGDHESIPQELRAPRGLSLAQFIAHQFVWMTAERLARDVLEIATRWRPDVLIHETTEFGGALAAELLGIPVVGLQIASPSLITSEVTSEVERALVDVRRSLDLPPHLARSRLEDHPILCFAPPALHDPNVPLPPGLLSFGPPPGPTDTPEPFEGLGRDRPLVYATLGTVFSDPAFELPFFPAIIDGLAGEDLDLVVAVGPNGDPASLGEQPENVRVATYVPQRALLERCAAVICHGGYGTLLDAIEAGVPLVVVPFGADQHINGQSVARLGIGQVIDDDDLTPGAARDAILALLREQAWGDTIRRLRDAWRALPGPESAASVVERAVADAETIDLAERSAFEYGPDRERLGTALRERADDVVALLERLVRDEPARALRLAAALPAFWEDLGRVDDGRRLTEAALDRAGTGHADAAAAQLAAAELAFRQGDQAEATRRTRIAIDLATDRDGRVAALGHVNLARVAYRDGNAPEIDAHARRALELAPDDIATRRGALHMLAWAAHTAGDLGLARARFEESLELRRSMDDRFGAAVEIGNLGDLAAEDGDLGAAAAHLGEALEVAAELDSQYLILNLLPSLAAVAAAAGDDPAAARLVGAADEVGRRSGLVPDPGAWQPSLDAAERRLGEAFPILRAEGADLGLAETLALCRHVASTVAETTS